MIFFHNLIRKIKVKNKESMALKKYMLTTNYS